MTGPTHLPNETLSVIINQLDGDLKTLEACRLASYTLCSLATPLRFSSMHFSTRNVTSETAVKWNQILSNNDIAGSVRTLTIRSGHKTHEFQDSTTGSIIAKILHRLPHIQNFTLRASNYCYFNTISEDLGLAIRALFRSPNLKNVDLSHLLDFPLTLITTCPNLRNLSTAGVSFSVTHLPFFNFLQRPTPLFQDNEVDDTSNVQGSYLDSLDLWSESLKSLGACVRNHRSFAEKFSRLNKIKIDDANLSYPRLLTYDLDILLLASQSLTTLAIHTTCDGTFHLDPCIVSYICIRSTHYKMLGEDSQLAGGRYHLSRFPNLQHLEIQLAVYSGDNNLFPFLNQLLSISSPTSLLETLTIMIHCLCEQSGDLHALLSPNSGWSTLEETLTSNKFISLRQVSFKFYTYTIGPQLELELRRSLARPYINALFPMLRALSNTQGTLEIDIQIG